MNNNSNFIRISRCEGEAMAAPEYLSADNQLIIDVTLDGKISGADEMSVCVYNYYYKYMGRDAVTLRGKKPVGKLHFVVTSEEEWESDAYFVTICRNGVPVWMSEFYLEGYKDIPKKSLMDIDTDDNERAFFIREVSTKRWWEEFKTFGMTNCDTETYVKMFYVYGNILAGCYEEKDCQVLVAGEYGWAKRLATTVFGGFLSDDGSKPVYSFRMTELFGQTLTWKSLTDNIAKCRVALVDLSGIAYDKKLLEMVDCFAGMVRGHVFSGVSFVFFCEQDLMECLLNESVEMSIIRDGGNYFRMPTESRVSDSVKAPRNIADAGSRFNRMLSEYQAYNELAAEFLGKKKTEASEAHAECKASFAENKLNCMVGLERVKREVADAKMLALFDKERQRLGLAPACCGGNHFLFYGNPGTGKTTVARLIGEMYYNMGLLSRGHTVEVNRQNLVGEYIGQTESHMKEVLEQAQGGVLFIDEAYTLIHDDDDTRDFGKEVINALLTVITSPDCDMIVILAGYEDKMKYMMQYNPGLASRFPIQLHFDDYNANELLEMAIGIIRDKNFMISGAAVARLKRMCEAVAGEKRPDFGNGRWVHNLIEHHVLKNMAKRVMQLPHACDDQRLLSTIDEQDIIASEEEMKSEEPQKTVRSRIGF